MSTSSPVTLRLTDSEGNFTDEVLPGPGGTVRVVIGEPGCHSGVWRIFAPDNKSDVYIGIRTILGHQKWSLHESGDWRFQWVTEERAQEFTNSRERVIDRWPQPAEVGQTGWTKSFSIRVRHQDLVAVPDEQGIIPAETLWLPSPPEGRVAAVHVVIARPDQLEVALHGVVPFAAFTLADGRVVLLVFSMGDLTNEHNKMVDDAIDEATRRVPSDKLATAGAARAALVGNTAEGERFVWDCVVPKQVQMNPDSPPPDDSR